MAFKSGTAAFGKTLGTLVQNTSDSISNQEVTRLRLWDY